MSPREQSEAIRLLSEWADAIDKLEIDEGTIDRLADLTVRTRAFLNNEPESHGQRRG